MMARRTPTAGGAAREDGSCIAISRSRSSHVLAAAVSLGPTASAAPGTRPGGPVLQEMRDCSLNVPTIIAGLALATLRIVTFYIFGQRFFVRGLVAGALKGE